jgi:hypothetical protein
MVELYRDPNAVHWEDVTLTDGEVVKLPFRSMSRAKLNEYKRMVRESNSLEGEEADIAEESATAWLLAQSLCDENGNLVPVETTTLMWPGYADAIGKRILVLHKMAPPAKRKDAPQGN